MTDNSKKNKRLAKNTIFLYFRMLYMMIITLYTSRVTLEYLGVEDFGIYNIVSGVVVLFAFLSRTLSSACGRYLSKNVEDKQELQKVFSTSIFLHVVLSAIVIILLETLGLWFVEFKLNIPDDRQFAASIIYQISVIATILSIMRIPFSSSIIAHEKMGFYASISILEGMMKLLVVYLLVLIPFDKLIVYSILILISILVSNILYIIYCVRNFDGNKLKIGYQKNYLKKMLVFSGWNLLGGSSEIASNQGSNIILNWFYGVSLNATMGVTNQVRAAIYSFVANLQTAANPQIILSYSEGDLKRFETLFFSISKYSIYMMAFLSIPLIVNIDFILGVWLKEVPIHTSNFVILLLICGSIEALIGPVFMALQANGNIKKYSIIVSVFLLSNIPLTYMVFVLGCTPESMLMVKVIVTLIEYIIVSTYACNVLGIKYYLYIKNVLQPIFFVLTITSIATLIPCCYLETGVIRLILSCSICVLTILLSIYIFGTNNSEKIIIREYIIQKIKYVHP